MRLVYLDTIKPDLAWFRQYYRSTFAQGSALASRQYLITINILMANPYIGRPIGEEDFRKLTIGKTPFLSFIASWKIVSKSLAFGISVATPKRWRFTKRLRS